MTFGREWCSASSRKRIGSNTVSSMTHGSCAVSNRRATACAQAAGRGSKTLKRNNGTLQADPDAAGRTGPVRGTSRGGTAGVSDRDIPGLVRPSGADLDLDVIAQRGEKAHEPFERDFGEFSAENLRQLGLRGSDPPRGDALDQAQGLDGLIQPNNELGLEIMLFGIGEAELQPDVPRRVFGRRCSRHGRASLSLIRSLRRFRIKSISAFGVAIA